MVGIMAGGEALGATIPTILGATILTGAIILIILGLMEMVGIMTLGVGAGEMHPVITLAVW
jgi:hypothetical protein